jgi:redox-sensing transcriptional repressor
VGSPIGDTTILSYGELGDSIRDKNIIVAVLAVPPEAAQQVADDVVEAGVKIIFNYTEALLDVPPEVTVHTTSPAVELLYALYFYLT